MFFCRRDKGWETKASCVKSVCQSVSYDGKMELTAQRCLLQLEVIMKKICRKLVGAAMCALLACLLLPGTAFAAPAETVNGHGITPVTMAMVTTRQVNVRSGPKSAETLLGSLEAGQVVNACGVSDNGWYQIVYGAGIGYVSGRLVAQVPVDDAMLAALAQQAALVKQNAAAQAALAQQNAAAQAALVQQEAAAQEALAQQNAAAQEALAQQEAAAQAALAQQQAAREAQRQAAAVSGGNVIFVGDSRTGQMGNAVGGSAAWPGVAFVACFGGGNEWLSTQKAKADIDQYVTPGSIIVLNYGVNDLSKHNEYISTINKYAADWRSKGAVVYFATVGPVGENEYGKRNWAVEYFNDQLNSRLDGSIGRIPLYSYLTMTGYTTTADGLHYTPDVYAGMFRYLMQSIGRM